MRSPVLAGVLVLSIAAGAAAQVRQIEPGTSGTVNVTYDHPDDAAVAERLRDLVFRVKPRADALYAVEEINLAIVHTQRELDLQLGAGQAGQLAGASYVRGVLFLAPFSWPTNPTDEALEAEMEAAVVRLALLRMAGGHRLPAWLDGGLVSFLTRQQFAPTTASLVAQRAEMLLGEWEASGPAVGYWAVRYLVEARGGLENLQRVLLATAQRPDMFFNNMVLVYNTSVGQLERDWRGWLKELAEEDRIQREGGVRRQRNNP